MTSENREISIPINQKGYYKKKIKPLKYRKLRNSVIILTGIIAIYFTTSFIINNSNFNHSFTYINTSKENKENPKNLLGIQGLEDFVPLFSNNTKGPITIDREKDDGTKQNIYSLILDTTEKDFQESYYGMKDFVEVPEASNIKEEYACENNIPLESGARNVYISCPNFYSLKIDNAFYGRYSSDKTHCITDDKNKPYQEKYINIEKTCGNDKTSVVKKFCEGKNGCYLNAQKRFYSNLCPDVKKFLHVKYHCEKTEEMKKQNMTIVMFFNYIKPNSIYENSVSEMYQYADIHGYKLLAYRDRIDYERSIYFTKLHSVLDAVRQALINKEYGWIFWIDGDTMIANPNIKLETFIPIDERINFIIAKDHRGINAGAFLVRVCSWSLNFMIRTISYQYRNVNKHLVYSDQTSITNVLFEDGEVDRYVVVPYSWFNTYPDKKEGGEFILHFAGRRDKKHDLMETREELNKDDSYMKEKTNSQLRKEVLDYYKLPKDKQIQFSKAF